MRAVTQRVSKASVKVDDKVVSEIENGLLILLGIEDADDSEDIEWLSRKIVNLRIFNDAEGVMNKSMTDTEGDAIVVSQFTLHGSTKKAIVLRISGPPSRMLQFPFTKLLSDKWKRT